MLQPPRSSDLILTATRAIGISRTTDNLSQRGLDARTCCVRAPIRVARPVGDRGSSRCGTWMIPRREAQSEAARSVSFRVKLEGPAE